MTDTYHHSDETCPCSTCQRLARLLEIAEDETQPSPEEWERRERLLEAREEAERDCAAAEALSDWIEGRRDDYRDEPMADFEFWQAGRALAAPRIGRDIFEAAELALAVEEEADFAAGLRKTRRAG